MHRAQGPYFKGYGLKISECPNGQSIPIQIEDCTATARAGFLGKGGPMDEVQAIQGCPACDSPDAPQRFSLTARLSKRACGLTRD